ncbi:expressed unknown protein [Ectocarpus siliculosus]|uniref:Uncharacterized protein n=1 Tax=Ectocarpus siliculosus TaxID=2880 RepID=D8LRB8_ECTSI|nr:expressed unknown protein [Ectocarpus siliculosus]|eukprot:CBN75023.1 expressed unknown protein [Ectocarpus siliculosus]
MSLVRANAGSLTTRSGSDRSSRLPQRGKLFKTRRISSSNDSAAPNCTPRGRASTTG